MEFSSFDFGERNHDSCSNTCHACGEVCLGGKVDRVIWAVDVLVDLVFLFVFFFLDKFSLHSPKEL